MRIREFEERQKEFLKNVFELENLPEDMEYATRPYEVKEGQTARVVKESIELLYERLKNRPIKGKKLDSLLWHVDKRV